MNNPALKPSPAMLASLIGTCFNILDKWGCNPDQCAAILGLPRATMYKYRKDTATAKLSRDQIERASYVLNIHAALRLIFSNPENQYGFMKLKNGNAYFNGASPMDLIGAGSFAALYETFCRIDAMRGARW